MQDGYLGRARGHCPASGGLWHEPYACVDPDVISPTSAMLHAVDILVGSRMARLTWFRVGSPYQRGVTEAPCNVREVYASASDRMY